MKISPTVSPFYFPSCSLSKNNFQQLKIGHFCFIKFNSGVLRLLLFRKQNSVAGSPELFAGANCMQESGRKITNVLKS